MAEHMYTYQDPSSPKDLARIVEVLNRGGVIAYPTDINWAFACHAFDTRAIDRIRLLKPHKQKEQPLSLVCRDISMVAHYAHVDHCTYRVLKRIFPGAFTVLLERNRSLPRQFKDKRKIIGVRIPQSSLVADLIDLLDAPLATSSVPLRPDGEGVHFGYEVFDIYGHALDLVVDLGQELPGTETTIVDFTTGSPEIIRLGAGDVHLITG